jgi:hypothetical protein
LRLPHRTEVPRGIDTDPVEVQVLSDRMRGEWVFPTVFLIRSGIMPVLLVLVLTVLPLLGLQLSGRTAVALAIVVGTEFAIDMTIIVWLRGRNQGH